MKTNLPRIPLIAFIIAAALYGCSSAPGSRSALTGTWRLTADDASAQVLQFQSDGTGTLTKLDAQNQVTETLQLGFAPDDDTRFRLIGKDWIWFIPCEVQGDRLTLTGTGEVFRKE